MGYLNSLNDRISYYQSALDTAKAEKEAYLAAHELRPTGIPQDWVPTLDVHGKVIQWSSPELD